METVRGLAADSVWEDVTSAVGATVCSSFQHAVNVELDAGLLTLVTAGGRRAPGALITDAASFPQIEVGTAVEMDRGTIRVGPMVVDLTQCVLFSCRCRSVGATKAEPGALGVALHEHAVPGSFVLSATSSPFDRAVQARLLHAARGYQAELAATLLGTSSGSLESAVGPLIGLGAGLTPSGDDYVVGSLALLHHAGARRDVLHAISAGVEGHLTRTTSVSGHFLRAALEGRFHTDIADAAIASLTAPTRISAAVQRVSLIGSTSGTDALYGLSETLNTCVCVPSLF